MTTLTLKKTKLPASFYAPKVRPVSWDAVLHTIPDALREFKPLAYNTRNHIWRYKKQDAYKADVRHVMAIHTRSPAYLRGLAAGGARYSLSGDADGEITPSEIAGAKVLLSGGDGA